MCYPNNEEILWQRIIMLHVMLILLSNFFNDSIAEEHCKVLIRHFFYASKKSIKEFVKKYPEISKFAHENKHPPTKSRRNAIECYVLFISAGALLQECCNCFIARCVFI